VENKKGSDDSSAQLRRQAEDKLKQNQRETGSATVADPQRLLHELQVHQIELEMQNAELRQARDDRESLLEQYTDLYDFAPVGYLTILRNGKIAKINLTGAKLLGIDRSRLNGHFLKTFLSAESGPIFDNFLTHVFSNLTKQTCEVATSKELEITRSLQLEAINSTSTETCHLVIIDNTENKKLQAEQDKLLAAMQQTDEMIVITDAEANIQYVNTAFEKITGYSAEEVIGLNPRILKSGEQSDHFYRELWATLTNGRTWKGQLINKKKNGMLYTEETIISPVRDATGHIISYVGVKNDITERLRKEEELRQKHKMEAVGYMAGGMAHNFNNNLSIILGNIELSQMKQQSDSEIIPFLENAKIAVRRSRDLVHKIITYSRKGMLSKVPMHLTTIIDETLGLLQSTLPTTINLQKTYSSGCHAQFIHADPSQIQEVLINLCHNAVDAMDETGDLTISLEPVELQQQDISAQYDCSPGSYSKISVQDSGTGISADMLDKIFDPFYSTKEEYEGAGMGLATVQGIVAQHGGMIKINTVLDQGTTFELYFPSLAGLDLEEEPVEERRAFQRGTEQILFVDDDERLATLGEQLLSTLGYQVSMMTDSAEALKVFTANADHFNLVITDQTMPGLTGIELITEIKKVKADTPTILCTGYSSKVDEDEAARLGISAFMMKPLDLPVLSQTIRQVLDGNKEN